MTPELVRMETADVWGTRSRKVVVLQCQPQGPPNNPSVQGLLKLPKGYRNESTMDQIHYNCQESWMEESDWSGGASFPCERKLAVSLPNFCRHGKDVKSANRNIKILVRLHREMINVKCVYVHKPSDKA